MSGLNSAVFAYGQTGAGKTHTMLGRLAGPKAAPSNEVRKVDSRLHRLRQSNYRLHEGSHLTSVCTFQSPEVVIY